MAQETGIVSAVSHESSNGSAYESAHVLIQCADACQTCASKNACMGGGATREIEALNPIGAMVGDRVLIEMKTGPLMTLLFIACVFPIFCLMAGAMAGHYAGIWLNTSPSLASMCCGMTCFGIACGWVKKKGNALSLKQPYQPWIIQRF